VLDGLEERSLSRAQAGLMAELTAERSLALPIREQIAARTDGQAQILLAGSIPLCRAANAMFALNPFNPYCPQQT